MWFLQSGCRVAAPQRPSPFFPEVHDEISRSWRSSYSARAQATGSLLLSSIDGADRLGYSKPPAVEEAVTAHLCPVAHGRKSTPSLPSKPCRTTAYIADKAYIAAGQTASAIHTMAVLQVFQAKMRQALDEQGPDPEFFGKLRSAMDLEQSLASLMAHSDRDARFGESTAVGFANKPEAEAIQGAEPLSPKAGCSSSTAFQIFLVSAGVCCIFFGLEEGPGVRREAQVQVLQETGTPPIKTCD